MRSKPLRPFLVCMTGGGTAGHVTPHFALLPKLRERGWQAFYIGSKGGIEGPLASEQGLEFAAVATGKLRRYVSWRNLLDLFKVVLGCLQAYWILLLRRPDVVFSKGGFVAVPVAWAAWLLRIPVVSHESDLTPGLATRLIKPVAQRIVYTFPETGALLGAQAEHVGTPVRAELLAGERELGLRLCGFDPAAATSVYLVMGGSQGAQKVNDALLGILPWLLTGSHVIHLTGKGKGIAFSHPRYKAFEYVSGELKDLLAACDFVISRAGANAIFEFLALRKPMLLIPLEQGSRGDQLRNAAAFAKAGWALTVREQGLTPAVFKAELIQLQAQAAAMRARQGTYDGRDAADRILKVLQTASGRL